MRITFPSYVIRPEPGEEIWVQTLSSGVWVVGVQLNEDQYTWLELTREQLEQLSTNILSALLEGPY